MNNLIEEIRVIRPCPINGEGFAICNFKRRLIMDILLLMLQNPKIMNLKYSKEDGIAMFSLNGSKILLDISGYTQINGIKGEKDTKILVEELGKIIQKAFS